MFGNRATSLFRGRKLSARILDLAQHWICAAVAVALLLSTASGLPIARAQEAAGKDASASDWPQLLGPARNGISTEKGLLKTWPQGGPQELWRVRSGGGMSGLAIVSGKVYTLVQKSGKQWAVALSADDGSPEWETPLAAEFKNSMGDGPRATPTVTGTAVFTFTGDGVLTSLKRDDGTIRWSHDVVSELGGKIADYGMACSPLVVGERVIVTAGAPSATVVAFHTGTGKLQWKADLGDPAGYSSPSLLTLHGERQVVVFDGAAVAGLDPKTGTARWRYPYPTEYDCNIATPLEVGGNVFISAGENHGCALLSLKPTAEKWTVGEIWQSQGSKSVLRNEWQTSIQLDGYLYGFDNVGSAGPVTHLTCIEAATGKRAWQELRFGKGNLIAADGKLFLTTMKGELVVAKATPSGYKELGRGQAVDTTRQAPALANGRLYLRGERDVVCFDVRRK